jgi:hypothetical protein
VKQAQMVRQVQTDYQVPMERRDSKACQVSRGYLEYKVPQE